MKAKDAIISHYGKAGRSDGANLLLEILSIKLKQSPNYQPLILGIFEENDDLVQAKERKCADSTQCWQQGSYSLLPETNQKGNDDFRDIR